MELVRIPQPVRLPVWRFEPLAPVEIELVLRAAGPADIDLAERGDAREVPPEVERGLGRRLGGNEDAVLSDPTLRAVEEGEATRIVEGERENRQLAAESVRDLARTEPPVREDEDVAPVEEPALGEGALEATEVDALEGGILDALQGLGEPREIL